MNLAPLNCTWVTNHLKRTEQGVEHFINKQSVLQTLLKLQYYSFFTVPIQSYSYLSDVKRNCYGIFQSSKPLKKHTKF